MGTRSKQKKKIIRNKTLILLNINKQMKTKKNLYERKEEKIESYLHVLFFKLLGFSSHYFIYLKRREKNMRGRKKPFFKTP